MTCLSLTFLLFATVAFGLPALPSDPISGFAELSSAPFANPDLEEYVIGGSPARSGQFPYQVKLLHNGQFMCGGSLISNRAVLTAAHCITRGARMSVVLGALGPSAEPQQVTMDIAPGGIFVHPNYEKDWQSNDIAVLKLPYPVNFNNNIQKIDLPGPGEASQSYNYNYRTATVSGWGMYRPGLSRASPQLLFADVIVRYFSGQSEVIGGRFQDKGPCMGDSGGPLAVGSGRSAVLIGVVSHVMYNRGEPPCSPNNMAVYTSVRAHRDWIQRNMG